MTEPALTTVTGGMRHLPGPVAGRTRCGGVIAEPHPSSPAHEVEPMQLPLCGKCARGRSAA